MEAVLQIKNLTKTYKEKIVLNTVEVSFEKGKIYSIIGVNGAGKTTFFNCIDGDIVYDSGNVTITENGIARKVEFEDIGLVSDSPILPDFLTGYEFINFFTELHKIKSDKTIDDYFDLVRINETDRHKLIKNYSFGMKNKVQLLCSIIRKPKIILLDEPLSSFDIIVSHDIKEILIKMKQDHIIVMSTHIMQLAQDISDEIVLLRDGKMAQLTEFDIKAPDFEQYIINELS